MMPRLSMFVALAFACACTSPNPERPSSVSSAPEAFFSLPKPTKVPKESFTHVISFTDTFYYLGGPQQARPPDGTFVKGTRMVLVRDSGSYSLVTSESGLTAYVATGSLSSID